jgi:hypothetical protein
MPATGIAHSVSSSAADTAPAKTAELLGKGIGCNPIRMSNNFCLQRTSGVAYLKQVWHRCCLGDQCGDGKKRIARTNRVDHPVS